MIFIIVMLSKNLHSEITKLTPRNSFVLNLQIPYTKYSGNIQYRGYNYRKSHKCIHSLYGQCISAAVYKDS